jgi:hypothetical protein
LLLVAFIAAALKYMQFMGGKSVAASRRRLASPLFSYSPDLVERKTDTLTNIFLMALSATLAKARLGICE